jgi:hypothetical protein
VWKWQGGIVSMMGVWVWGMEDANKGAGAAGRGEDYACKAWAKGACALGPFSPLPFKGGVESVALQTQQLLPPHLRISARSASSLHAKPPSG